MEESRSFEVKAETDDGYDIVNDTYEVPSGGTERIAGIGVPGATSNRWRPPFRGADSFTISPSGHFY